MTTPLTPQQMLADAQAALHKLQIGQMAVEVEIAGGMKVTFAPAQVDKLQAYVEELQALVAGATSCPGAIGFVF